jgi:hypothetical protein
MPKDRYADEGAMPIMVPRNVRPLATVTNDRVRRLRENLVRSLHDARELKSVDTLNPQPLSGFTAMVAGVACGLCKGWCCRNGGDDAYLDGDAIGRVRKDRPGLDAGALVRLYSSLVPSAAYEGSCIFHGRFGCTLDRSLRADICNSYFCGGLTAYFREGNKDAPRIVLAGKADAMRSSAVLSPRAPIS